MISQTAKYKSWSELIEAFGSGQLSRDQWAVFLDNDYAKLTYIGPAKGETEDQRDDAEERRCEEGRALFYCDGPVDIADILAAINVPSMWA